MKSYTRFVQRLKKQNKKNSRRRGSSVRAENRLKYRENMSRKARTHRLIVLGAVMEQYFPELKELSEVQFGQMMEHLDINAFHEAFYKALANGRQEDC